MVACKVTIRPNPLPSTLLPQGLPYLLLWFLHFAFTWQAAEGGEQSSGATLGVEEGASADSRGTAEGTGGWGGSLVW